MEGKQIVVPYASYYSWLSVSVVAKASIGASLATLASVVALHVRLRGRLMNSCGT